MELSRYQHPEWQERRDAERAAFEEFRKAQVRITGLLANHDGPTPEDLRRVFTRQLSLYPLYLSYCIREQNRAETGVGHVLPLLGEEIYFWFRCGNFSLRRDDKSRSPERDLRI
jgi:hypothetical protein